jgi:hypothetical protein
MEGIEEGLEVRAAARDEHGDTNRRLPFGHRWRLQRATDFGFDPLVTLNENDPVA